MRLLPAKRDLVPWTCSLAGAVWGFVLGIYFAITGDSSHTASARPEGSQQPHQLERQTDTVHTAVAPAQRAAAPLQRHSKPDAQPVSSKPSEAASPGHMLRKATETKPEQRVHAPASTSAKAKMLVSAADAGVPIEQSKDAKPDFDASVPTQAPSKDATGARAATSTTAPATPKQSIDRRHVQSGHTSSDDGPEDSIKYKSEVVDSGNAADAEADVHPLASAFARLPVEVQPRAPEDVTKKIKLGFTCKASGDAKVHAVMGTQLQRLPMSDLPAQDVQPAAKLGASVDAEVGAASPIMQGATGADTQSRSTEHQVSTWLEGNAADLADEDFGGVTARVAALREEIAVQPNASVLQKRVAEVLRSREGTALEKMTEEEAQERAMVDVMIAEMHAEEYREFGFPLPDNEPNPNAVEPRISADDFEGSEAWAAGSPAILNALEEFKKEWMDQPLPKLWMDVKDLSSHEGRQEALWCLFDSKMILS